MSMVYDVAVIGAGAAGQMALLRGVLNHLNTLVFLGDAQTTRKSRATWVVGVDNIPGFFDKKRPITATTREVLDFIKQHDDLSRFLTPIKHAATRIEKTSDGFLVATAEQTYRTRYVVLCTGTMDVQPLINGSIEAILPYANREDVLYCIRCDGHKCVGHACAVIGHTDAAAWIAIMLKERYDLPQLWILTNGATYVPEASIAKLLQQYDIPILAHDITGIHGDPKTGLTGFALGERNVMTTRAFVALGSRVYNQLAQDVGAALDARAHVLTNAKGETNISGFYAAGDLVSGKKKQVYTAWDMAVDAVDDIDRRIREAKRVKL